MAKLGRPETITPEMESALLEAFAIGCSDAEAMLYAEQKLSTEEKKIYIPASVFYDHQKRHTDFLDKKERLKEKPTLKARNSVVSHLDDPEFALKYLERKRKGEFSLRTETDITTQGNSINNITVTYIDKLEPNSDQTSEGNTGESEAV